MDAARRRAPVLRRHCHRLRLWRAWLALLDHPLSGAILRPYRLRSSDSDVEDRLLVDRELDTLDVGLALDVEQLLATQPSELRALTADMTRDEVEKLVDCGRAAWHARELAKTPEQRDHEAHALLAREEQLLQALTRHLDRLLYDRE